MVDTPTIDQWFEYGVDPKSRTIYLGDTINAQGETQGIDCESAERVIKGLRSLRNSTDIITIVLNSTGGDVYHGLAIYDAIKECEAHVIVHVYGQAFSMGAVILQAADTRVMTPSSRLMIHYGQVGYEDSAQTAYRWVDEYKRLDTAIEDIFFERVKKKHPSIKKSSITNRLKVDTIMSAQQALDFGLCDRISTPYGI